MLSLRHSNNEGTDEDIQYKNNTAMSRQIKRVSKYRPGAMIPAMPEYNDNVSEKEQPKILLSEYDYMKRSLFHKEKLLKIDSMCKWKKKDLKGMKKRLYINEIQ